VKVVWREVAEVQLYDQVGFIARDKPSTAEAILQTLTASAERLCQFPDMGVKGRVPGTRELVIPYLPYILVYRKHVDRVEILALLNTSQDR
jgi:plasmid stabilization system protein ParE